MSERFYFKQLQADKDKEGKPTIVTVEDSIEFDDVRRTRRYPDGTMIVLLKDGHEEAREMTRVINKKGDQEATRQRVWVQSEIRLMPDDAIRFRKCTAFLNDEFGGTALLEGDQLADANKVLGDIVEEQNKELREPTMEPVGPDKFLN